MVENTAAQDDVLVVQLFSDSGTFTKTLPVPAGNLLKINLKQWQQGNIPDDNGNSLTDTYGVIALAGKNGHLSKLSFDKLIHSAVDSDYVGLPGGPGSCVGMTDAFLFLSGSQSPYSVWEEEDWSDGTIEDFPAFGTASSNPSALQIYSTSSGDMANTYPWASTPIAFTGPVVSRMDCPACSVDDYTPSGLVNVPPPPTLQCTPLSLTRAQSSNCTMSGATVTSTGWKVTDGTNTVTLKSTAPNWSGTIVTSGTVSVEVTVDGTAAVTLTQNLTVNPRTGFAFTAVAPQQEPDPFTGNGCSLSVPSPPTSGGDAVGMFCLAEHFTVATAQVSGGPNNGYSYVSSVSPSDSKGSTAYYWTISPDLQNTASTFYQAQCGNYNAQTNPNGFISGANLNSNTIRHESGSAQSHYQNYAIAQNLPANNLGTVGEAIVGLTDPNTLASNATATLNGKQSTITTATQVEPCDVEHDASCVFQGFINFFPYQACH